MHVLGYAPIESICVNCRGSVERRSIGTGSRMYLLDGNWFDFKDGKWYANFDLNKAPNIIRFFLQRKCCFFPYRNRFFVSVFISGNGKSKSAKEWNTFQHQFRIYILRSNIGKRRSSVLNYINWNCKSQKLILHKMFPDRTRDEAAFNWFAAHGRWFALMIRSRIENGIKKIVRMIPSRKVFKML